NNSSRNDDNNDRNNNNNSSSSRNDNNNNRNNNNSNNNRNNNSNNNNSNDNNRTDNWSLSPVVIRNLERNKKLLPIDRSFKKTLHVINHFFLLFNIQLYIILNYINSIR